MMAPPPPRTHATCRSVASSLTADQFLEDEEDPAFRPAFQAVARQSLEKLLRAGTFQEPASKVAASVESQETHEVRLRICSEFAAMATRGDLGHIVKAALSNVDLPAHPQTHATRSGCTVLSGANAELNVGESCASMNRPQAPPKVLDEAEEAEQIRNDLRIGIEACAARGELNDILDAVLKQCTDLGVAVDAPKPGAGGPETSKA